MFWKKKEDKIITYPYCFLLENGKAKLHLKWDYSAYPTWTTGGANRQIEEFVKDKEKIKEIENWYEEFNRAEIAIDSGDTSEDEMRKAAISLRDRLIPWGRKIANDIGADFFVDLGHSELAKKVELEVFQNNDGIRKYWEGQNNLKKALSKNWKKNERGNWEKK